MRDAPVKLRGCVVADAVDRYVSRFAARAVLKRCRARAEFWLLQAQVGLQPPARVACHVVPLKVLEDAFVCMGYMTHVGACERMVEHMRDRGGTHSM